jgi:CheY-like chemotaxis protein
MRTLLIVDDSQDDLEVLQESLADAGVSELTILVATDGDEGLETIKTLTASDLVLLDLNMPRMHGFKVLEEVRRLQLQTPIVVCSTSNDEEDIVGSISRGARAYLTKPDEYPKTVEMIRRTHAFWELAR